MMMNIKQTKHKVSSKQLHLVSNSLSLQSLARMMKNLETKVDTLMTNEKSQNSDKTHINPKIGQP